MPAFKIDEQLVLVNWQAALENPELLEERGKSGLIVTLTSKPAGSNEPLRCQNPL